MADQSTLPQGISLLSIRQDDGEETLGLLDGPVPPAGAGAVLDVRRARDLLDLPAPLSLEEMFRQGSAPQLHALARAARERPGACAPAWRDIATLRHGRLLRAPGKIVCIGLNYRRHAQEVGAAIPERPVLFSKFANTLAAHGEPLRLPPPEVARKFDYETELVVVIGRHARNLGEDQVLSCVAGYCVGNDFSARDLQGDRGGQWLLGKTLDGFAPLGPWFVSADLVGDPHQLALQTRVNGELRQDSNTSDLIFGVPQLIADITRHFALEPGDLIFTGTPEGVILGSAPGKRVWLKAGDELRCSIERLGELRFTLE